MKSAEAILSTYDLRVTQPRVQVLEHLMAAPGALAQADLERMLAPDADRVTIYRTLKTFISAGVLHRIPDPEGQPRYALCAEPSCARQEHTHSHVHFKCTTCQQTTCLEHIMIPDIKLPARYTQQEVTLLIEGTCATCPTNGVL
jgi:Fur family transcriptional regulator, ferric uptake regulator